MPHHTAIAEDAPVDLTADLTEDPAADFTADEVAELDGLLEASYSRIDGAPRPDEGLALPFDAVHERFRPTAEGVAW